MYKLSSWVAVLQLSFPVGHLLQNTIVVNSLWKSYIRVSLILNLEMLNPYLLALWFWSFFLSSNEYTFLEKHFQFLCWSRIIFKGWDHLFQVQNGLCLKILKIFFKSEEMNFILCFIRIQDDLVQLPQCAHARASDMLVCESKKCYMLFK